MHLWFLAGSIVVVPLCLYVNAMLDRREAARRKPVFASDRARPQVVFMSSRTEITDETEAETPTADAA